MRIGIGGSQSISIIDPNICPHCHITNHPRNDWFHFTNNTDGDSVLLTAWQCASQECNKIYLAEYNEESHNNYIFKRFLNGLPKGPEWPEPILNLKNSEVDTDGTPKPSKFIRTYLQSLEAENNGLDELAGMGYRKAVEYLVKDWAISKNPEKEEEIRGSWLAAVISTYYDGDLKEILDRATWLGNDQSHYNKLFEEYDLDVLKELIGLIMVELDRQYKKDHYIKTIEKRK